MNKHQADMSFTLTGLNNGEQSNYKAGRNGLRSQRHKVFLQNKLCRKKNHNSLLMELFKKKWCNLCLYGPSLLMWTPVFSSNLLLKNFLRKENSIDSGQTPPP